MKKFITLLFAVLLSTNVFAFKLAKQDDGRVFVINDAGTRVAAFYKTKHRLLLSNSCKTVKVFDISAGELLKEFHEGTTTESESSSASTDTALSRPKRKADDECPSPAGKRINILTDDEAASTTPTGGAASAAAAAAAATSTTPPRFSWTSSSTSNSPAKGGAAGAAAAAAVEEDSDDDEYLSYVLGIISNSDRDSCGRMNGLSTEHITGYKTHSAVLSEFINTATEGLLICSQDIRSIDADIYQDLLNAHENGVRVDIFYNKTIDAEAQELLEGIASLHKLNVHAKFLIADNTVLVIGSHNWLDFRYKNGTNNSLLVHGRALQKITCNIDTQLENYTNRVYTAFDNADEEEKLCLELDRDDILLTLQQHEAFFDEACRNAQEKIIIHSPFVTHKNALDRISRAVKLISENVRIEFHVWEDTYRQNDLKRLQERIARDHDLSQRVKVNVSRSQQKNHSKTLVVDDERIRAEGSFNWLSSSTSESSPGHNLDATVVVYDYLND